MISVTKLLVENMESGCVTDLDHPSFSYQVGSDTNGVSVRKARITCNGWEWSGMNQTGILYAGKELEPYTTYEVCLEVTSSNGETATATAFFDTGKRKENWDGIWITDEEYHFTKKKTSPLPMTFQKSITVNAGIKKARIYSTAIGVYELKLNGSKVGEDYFAPGFTSYKHQLQYQIYDVTSELISGENDITAVVAGGWAVGSFTYKRRNRVYAKRQAFLFELRIEYEDGSTQIIGSNNDWNVTEDGRYKFAEFYDGEVYDATVNCNDISWRKAAAENMKLHPQLLAQYGAPVREYDRIAPVNITDKTNSIIYDMGQNFSGVLKLDIKNASKGQTITVRHAEILMNGKLYTEPLRTAQQKLVYICTDGAQTYHPRLTSMGFRYAEITGINADDIEVTGIAICSDVSENGSFTCSNEMVNRLQSAIRWGARSNFIDIPTDCPQRDERMGWTGDIALFSRTASYNFDMSRFFDKWLIDVKTEQNWGGGIPMIVPLVRVPMQWEIMLPMAVDHWGDACILVPWAEYLTRGNTELLKKMYPTMKRYMKACSFWAGLFSFGQHRHIWKLLHHYGDWCAPNANLMTWMGRGKWTATACMANSYALLSRIARIIGEDTESEKFMSLSKKASKAYRDILMQDDCSVKKEFQTAYVLPLYYEMLSPEDKKKTAANLARMVNNSGYHIETGFPGTPYILFALADNGYEDEAMKMLLTDTCPSWLYEVKVGGTTIWERWDALKEDGTCNTGDDDGTGGMVSFNHYASGAVGDFLYRRVAGIEALEGGYKRFRIRPLYNGTITSAKGQVDSAYGTIVSDWKVADNVFTINVEIPVGCDCTLELPNGDKHILASGSYEYSINVA